ncbi:MAG TPA: LysR family transcriptional regulator, partial [Xanthobacteraceae bacterium]|nr:LysR family transcriptional regulator [Xanthobacteraceae bacterium]
GLLPLFSAKRNPKLVPVLPDEVKVYRQAFLSVHEDLEFQGRVKPVIKHLSAIFEKDHQFLNSF